MLEQQLLVDQAIEDAALLGGIEVDAPAFARHRAGEARQGIARDRLAVHQRDRVRGHRDGARAVRRAAAHQRRGGERDARDRAQDQPTLRVGHRRSRCAHRGASPAAR